MKILSGFQPADSGRISVDGAAIALGSPAEASAAGIGMLHQDPLVFLPMSVLENYMLANPEASDRSRAKEELAAAAGRFGFALDPDTPVRRLSIGERQQLEILRLISAGVRVLILDEPTTAISVTQRAALFATLRALAADGTSVVFVSHKLDEVEELCTRVVVMRAGKVVGDRQVPCPARRPGRADVRQPGRAGGPATVAGGGYFGAPGGGDRRRPPGAVAPCRPLCRRRRGLGAGRHRGKRPAATLARPAPGSARSHRAPSAWAASTSPAPVTGSGSTPASVSSPPTAPRRAWSVG